MKRMKRGCKRNVTLFFVVCVVCVSMCGCAGSQDTVTDDKEKTVKKEQWKYHYSTDTNLYVYDWYEDEERITQVRLDGTHEKEIVRIRGTEEFWLCRVENSWLYYGIDGEKGNIIYRAPIEKDTDGYDLVKMSEKEELVREEELYEICLDSNYLIYDNGVDVITYDLQKKKSVSEWEYPEDTTGNGGLVFFCLNGKYVCLIENRGLFVQEQGSGEWRNCYSGERVLRKFSREYLAQTQKSLFFIEEPDAAKKPDEQKQGMEIMKYDGESVQCFVTENQIEKLAEIVKGVDSDESGKCTLTGLYETNGRLYLQVEFDWYKGDDVHMQYLVFSQGEEERELRYEKELTECMQSKVRERSQKLDVYSNRITNDAQCVAMLSGCAYLSLYDYEKDEGRMGCYDIRTGKFYWVREGEILYGELARAYMPENFSEVYVPKEYDNEYIGFAGVD